MASLLGRIPGFGSRSITSPACRPLDSTPIENHPDRSHEDNNDLDELCMDAEMLQSSYTLGRVKSRSSSANPYTTTYEPSPIRHSSSPIDSHSNPSRNSSSAIASTSQGSFGPLEREEDPERMKSIRSQISTLITLVGGVKKQQSLLEDRIDTLEELPNEMKSWVKEAISASGIGRGKGGDHQEEMDILREVKSLAEMTRGNVERLGAQKSQVHNQLHLDHAMVEKLKKRVEELEREKRDEAEKRERERLVEQAERLKERSEMETKLENALLAVQNLTDKVENMVDNQAASGILGTSRRQEGSSPKGRWVNVDSQKVHNDAAQTLAGPSIQSSSSRSVAVIQIQHSPGPEGSTTIDPRQLKQTADGVFMTEPTGSFNFSSLDQTDGDIGMDQYIEDSAGLGNAPQEEFRHMVQEEPIVGADEQFYDANEAPRDVEVKAIAATQGVAEADPPQTAGLEPQYDTDTSGGPRLVTPTRSRPTESDASQQSTPENHESTRSRSKRTSTSSTVAKSTPVATSKKRRVRQGTDIPAEFAARRLGGRKPFPTASPASAKKTAKKPTSTTRLRKSKGEIWRANVKTLLAGDGIPRGKGEWPPKCEYTVEGKANEIICDVCKGRAHYFCAGIADGEAPPEGDWYCPDCVQKLRSGIPKGVIEIAPQQRCIRAKCLLRAKVRTVRKPGDENVYYPERIIGRKAVSRNPDTSRNFLYLVKWLDWDVDYSTWEPQEHFPHQESLIQDFAEELRANGISSRFKVNLLPEAMPHFDADTGELINGTDVEREVDGSDGKSGDENDNEENVDEELGEDESMEIGCHL